MISLDILIPYYGDPDYLFRAVASARALVDTTWRMIIIEDCYPDGKTVEKRIKELGDERITYVRNEKNLGVAGNQHRAMEMAEQDYFVVLDADDLLLPNYGQQVFALINKYPQAGLIQPGVQVIDEQGQPYRPLPDLIKSLAKPKTGEFELAGEKAAQSLLRGNWLYTPALTYRREITRDLTRRDNCDAVNDLSMVLDVIFRGGSLVIGDQVSFCYRRHRQSHSTTTAKDGRRFDQEREFFADIIVELEQRNWFMAAKAARRRLYSRLNALTRLPGALTTRQGATVKTLLAHALR